MGKGLFNEIMSGYSSKNGSGELPISLGYTETSNEVVLDMKQLQHVLISGMSQSGKSTMVRKMLPALVKYADVAIFSTKDSDFIDYQDLAYCCSDVDEMGSLVRRTVGEVERRNGQLREDREEHGMEAKCEAKPVVVLIDEFQSFTELASEATMIALKRIVREGAGLNVFLYIITQKPSKKVLSDGLRDNIMTDIAFKQRDGYGSRMAIGSRAAEFLELHQCIVRNVDKTFTITRFDKLTK